jgi:Tuberculosis necrotizing toxin
MPWLGRWCAVDTLEAKYAGLNGYAYCANNPLLYIDIDGKDIIVFTTVLVQIPTVNIDQKTGQQTQAYNTITQCYTTAIIAEGPNEYFERTIIAYVDNTMKVLPLESEKQDVTKKVSAYDHVKAGKLITQFGLPSWYTDRSFISTPNSSASRAAENELSGLKQTQQDVEFYQQDKESKETQLLVVKSAGTLLLSELALGIFGLSAMFGNTAEYIEYLVSRGAIESSTFSAVRASSMIVEDLAANGTNLISYASNCEEVANCVNYASFLEEAAAKGGGTTALAKYWPENGGALGKWQSEFLMPGTEIYRFGSGFGKYFSPRNTPMDMRALPESNSAAYNAFRVVKPFEVQSSTIAPAFGKIGLGTQYLSPVNMNTLLKRGIIVPIQ